MSSGLDERKQALETGINLESRSVKQSALDALTANESAGHAGMTPFHHVNLNNL